MAELELAEYVAEESAHRSLLRDVQHELRQIARRSLPGAATWMVLLVARFMLPQGGTTSAGWVLRELIALVAIATTPILYALHSPEPTVFKLVHLSSWTSVVFAVVVGAALITSLDPWKSNIGSIVIVTGSIWGVAGATSGFLIFQRFVKSKLLVISIGVSFGCIAMGAQQLSMWYFTLSFWLKRQGGIVEFTMTGIAYPLLAALMGKVMLTEVVSTIFVTHLPGVSRVRSIRALAFISELTFYLPCEMVALLVSNNVTFVVSNFITIAANAAGLYLTVRLMQSGTVDKLLVRKTTVFVSKAQTAVAPRHQDDTAVPCPRLDPLRLRQARRALLYTEVMAAESFVTLMAPLCAYLFIKSRAPCMVQFGATTAALRVLCLFSTSFCGAILKKRVLWSTAGVSISSVRTGFLSPVALLVLGAPLLTVLHAMDNGLDSALLLTGANHTAFSTNTSASSLHDIIRESSLCAT